MLIIAAVAVKMNTKGVGDNMIKKVYVYLVLFATLMMTIGGGVSVFMNLADILSPTSGYYQTFEEYRMYQTNKENATQTQTEDELRNSYERMIAENRENQVGRATNSLIKSLGWIIIPLPIFIYFQRKLNKAMD